MSSHLVRAQNLLEKHHLSYSLIQTPVDLLYCTGLHISQGSLLVGRETSTLFLDGRYYEMAKNLPLHVVRIEDLKDFYLAVEGFFSQIAGDIGFNPHTMSVDAYEKLSASCCGKNQLVKTPAYYADLRRKKDSAEIEAITKACALCEKGFAFLLEEIRPGVTEKDLASKLKSFWVTHGAQGVSFEPIIAFDQHTSIPHWRSSEMLLRDQGIVLIDIGVQAENYHSDMTRVVFLKEPDEKLMKIWSIVKAAYERAFAFAAPGVTPHHLDSVAREYISEQGYGNFFVHGLGHGLGLEVHEPPKLSHTAPQEPPFEIGDVFTIEPGIYIPGHGGVRLENTIVLEKEGARSLISLPLEPIFLP